MSPPNAKRVQSGRVLTAGTPISPSVHAGSPSRRTNLPVLGPVTVQTPSLLLALQIARIAVSGNEIATFDGVPGLGKTTFLSAFARETKMPRAYVAMRPDASPKDAVASIFEAVTGTAGYGTRRDIEDDLISELVHHPVVLLLDEMHQAGQRGLMSVARVWDEVGLANNGTTFPIFLTGSGIAQTLTTVPNLRSRMSLSMKFEPLQPAELGDFLRAISPRFAATSPSLLARYDRNIGQGNPRAWTQVLKHLQLIHPSASAEAFTEDDFRTVLQMRGGL